MSRLVPGFHKQIELPKVEVIQLASSTGTRLQSRRLFLPTSPPCRLSRRKTHVVICQYKQGMLQPPDQRCKHSGASCARMATCAVWACLLIEAIQIAFKGSRPVYEHFAPGLWTAAVASTSLRVLQQRVPMALLVSFRVQQSHPAPTALLTNHLSRNLEYSAGNCCAAEGTAPTPGDEETHRFIWARNGNAPRVCPASAASVKQQFLSGCDQSSRGSPILWQMSIDPKRSNLHSRHGPLGTQMICASAAQQLAMQMCRDPGWVFSDSRVVPEWTPS